MHYFLSLAPTRCTLFVQSITHLVHQMLRTFEGMGMLPYLANVLRTCARTSQPANMSIQFITTVLEYASQLTERPGQQDDSKVTVCKSSPSSRMNLLYAQANYRLGLEVSVFGILTDFGIKNVFARVVPHFKNRLLGIRLGRTEQDLLFISSCLRVREEREVHAGSIKRPSSLI